MSALTLAGVLGARATPQPAAAPPPERKEVDTHFATQPELEQALLKVEDLPTPSPHMPPPPRLRFTASRRPPNAAQGCWIRARSLREATSRVLSRPEATDQAASELGGLAPLTQLLTTFAGDGALETMRELRKIGNGCRDFSTTVDGAPVRVIATVVRDDDAPTRSS